MKHIIYTVGFVAMLLSCSHIDDNDRLIEVAIDNAVQQEETTQQEEIVRNVLLEDFTGQRCKNCPNGAEVISQLEQAYGERFVPVGIYWEPIAVPNGLATETGKEYFSHWSVGAQPAGWVDRLGDVKYIPNDWMGDVKEALKRPADVVIHVEATLAEQMIDISVMETCPQSEVGGNLQVWIVEDSITATQLMPDNTAKRDYVHNHVFRTAVNGTWGDAVTIAVGDTLKQVYRQAIDNQWNTNQLSVVAFIYNGRGVEQVTKTRIKTTQDK